MEIVLSVNTIFHSLTTTSSSKAKPLNHKHQFKPLKNPGFTLPHYSKHTNSASHLPLISHSQSNPLPKYIKQTTSFVGKHHHQFQELKLGKLGPVQLLQEDCDWDNTHFWDVIEILHQASRFQELLEVFNAWIKLQPSRVNEFNYTKIIGLLIEAEMVDEATVELQNMKNLGLQLSTEVYNSVVHGHAQKGKFDDALHYLNEMKEMNVNPDTETYDGLIRGYGKFQMYDEMVNCLKLMESSGCSPDLGTYNLLIHELSKARLLNRMERMYQTVNSKNLGLQSSTLVAMLETYADVRMLDKMERFYFKVRNSRAVLKERLIRKIARVYIENFMFSRLSELGNDVAARMGRTNLFWCLHLLSHACLLSKKGMNDVITQMEDAGVPWSITVANIVSLACLKMKDFKLLNTTFLELPHRHVQPDVVTFGILYDGYNAGFDGSSTVKLWRKHGYLRNCVELHTDPLVFNAFGKGLFLSSVEEMYSMLEPTAREDKEWTYEGLVNLVLKHHSP